MTNKNIRKTLKKIISFWDIRVQVYSPNCNKTCNLPCPVSRRSLRQGPPGRCCSIVSPVRTTDRHCRRFDHSAESRWLGFKRMFIHRSGNTENKLYELTARQHLKSPRSLSGRSLHLTLVTKWSRSHLTLKIQMSRSWPRSNPLVTSEAWSSIDMFAFRFVAIGLLLVEI